MKYIGFTKKVEHYLIIIAFCTCFLKQVQATDEKEIYERHYELLIDKVIFSENTKPLKLPHSNPKNRQPGYENLSFTIGDEDYALFFALAAHLSAFTSLLDVSFTNQRNNVAIQIATKSAPKINDFIVCTKRKKEDIIAKTIQVTVSSNGQKEYMTTNLYQDTTLGRLLLQTYWNIYRPPSRENEVLQEKPFLPQLEKTVIKVGPNGQVIEPNDQFLNKPIKEVVFFKPDYINFTCDLENGDTYHFYQDASQDYTSLKKQNALSRSNQETCYTCFSSKKKIILTVLLSIVCLIVIGSYFFRLEQDEENQESINFDPEKFYD